MRKIFLIVLTIVLVSGLILGGCAKPAPAPAPAPAPGPPPGPPPAPKPKPIEIKIVAADPKPDLAYHLQCWDLVERVEEKSGGAIKFNFLGGEDVIPVFEQFDALKSGALIDAVWTPAGRAEGIVKEAMALMMTRMSSLERRASGFEDFYNELFQKQGLYWFMNGDSSDWDQFLRLWSRVPITKIEDFKGMKIAATPSDQTFFESLGAATVMMSPFDMYTAAERGVVDAISLPGDDQGVPHFSMHEVCKYYFSPGYACPDYAWTFNLKSWNKIPPDLQKMMSDTVLEVEKDWELYWVEWHEGWETVWEEHGLQETALSKEEAEQFQIMYFDVTWGDILAKSPENGAKLKSLCGQ